MSYNFGQEVYFGNYYFENNSTTQPVSWIVLEETKDSVLLLTKNIIEAMAYDDPSMDDFPIRIRERLANKMSTDGVFWSECTLRNWLNNDFIKTAFDKGEIDAIISTTIKTSDSPTIQGLNPFDNSTRVDGGPDVIDSVFCLSVQDVEKYFTKVRNVPVSEINPILSGRVAQDAVVEFKDIVANGTPYAISNRLYHSGGWWWLRNPGGANDMVAVIQNGKILYKPGEAVDDKTIGVRPALWVKKEFLNRELEQRGEIEDKLKCQEELGEQCEVKRQRRLANVCQYCGGKFKGLFIKKCVICRKKKDY